MKVSVQRTYNYRTLFTLTLCAGVALPAWGCGGGDGDGGTSTAGGTTSAGSGGSSTGGSQQSGGTSGGSSNASGGTSPFPSTGGTNSGSGGSGPGAAGSTGNACADCLQEKCTDLTIACAQNADCAAVASCAGDCQDGDETCLSSCLEANPEGAEAFQAVVECTIETCATECS